MPLKVLKESNPIEIAEYVTALDIENEPAFSWWVPFTLRKRDRIISGMNVRVQKHSHKFGRRIPKDITEARKLDTINGNRLWQNAHEKEMFEVGVAFKILDENEPLPVGYKNTSGHLIFDCKMDFTRKARWVKDGHLTPDLETSKYAGVVSRESI